MCPVDVKPKPDVALQSGEQPGHEHINGNSAKDMEELEEEDDSDSSSPPLPYLQAPAPDGCCTLDGIISMHLRYGKIWDNLFQKLLLQNIHK